MMTTLPNALDAEKVFFDKSNKYIVSFFKHMKFNPEVASTEADAARLRKCMSDAWKSGRNQTNYDKFVRGERVKQPKNKYLFFCDEKRKEIQQANPDTNIKDITRQLGTLWQEFKKKPDPTLDEKLTAMAEEDKQRFLKNKRITPKEVSVFRSLYLFYCHQQREKEPKITMTELAQSWAAFKQEEGPYERLKLKYEHQKKALLKLKSAHELELQRERDIEVVRKYREDKALLDELDK